MKVTITVELHGSTEEAMANANGFIHTVAELAESQLMTSRYKTLPWGIVKRWIVEGT